MHAKRVLLDLIDEAFDHRAWHGTTLLGSIRGLNARRAAWRPSPKRHNIWEEVVHAAYWKYAVRRRLAGDKRGAFALKGSNWFTRPTPGPSTRGSEQVRQWEEDVRLLVDEHRRLRTVVASLPERALGRPVGKNPTAAFLIRGVAAHDLYHAGQIQLLKRLGPSAR